MEKTYEQMIELAAYSIWCGDGVDDYDKGELSGAALMIAAMFGKSKRDVKKDIRDAFARL